MGVIIFHGPSAYDHALEKSVTPGFRPICPPIGAGGLKKEDAKTVIELVSQPPVGDPFGTLVVGPLDLATVSSSDALLKSLEDGRDPRVVLILWAEDIGEVRPTIRSRCLSMWCPGSPSINPDLLQYAEEVILALSKNDLFEITLLFEKIKSLESEFLRVLLILLAKDPLRYLDLWSSLRPLCSAKKITRVQLIAPFAKACMGGSK